MVPAGSSTSCPSVAAIMPPPPMRTPTTAPLTPPRMPPTIAPMPAPMAISPSPRRSLRSDRLRDRRLDRIAAPVDRNAIEHHRHLARPIDAAGSVHRADHPAHPTDPPGRRHLLPIHQIDGPSSLRLDLRPTPYSRSSGVESRRSTSVPAGTSSVEIGARNPAANRTRDSCREAGSRRRRASPAPVAVRARSDARRSCVGRPRVPRGDGLASLQFDSETATSSRGAIQLDTP